MIKYIYWLIFRKKANTNRTLLTQKPLPPVKTMMTNGFPKDCGITVEEANEIITKAFKQ